MNNSTIDDKNTLNTDDRNALLAFLQVIRDNTEFYMRQQWTTTNYALLLYGSIIYVLIGCSEKIIIAVVSTVIGFLAIVAIKKLDVSLSESREMAGIIYEKIPILKSILKGQDHTSLISRFIVIIIFGDVAVIWLLIKK